MESLLSDKWEVPSKHSSTEALQRWRDLCGVVKNPKRRFRFTANLSKRHEAAAMRKTNQVGDDVKIIDASGKYVMPGGIDPHTHLTMEFMGTETIDDFYSGRAAALAGGTTMHIDFVIPVNGNLSAGYESYVKKAERSAMDYGFHMAITKWDETVFREMEVMVKEKGINSFKFFLVYKGSLMISDELLLEGFKK